MECLVCFTTPENYVKCQDCDKRYCFKCLDEYLFHTEKIIKCECGKYLFPDNIPECLKNKRVYEKKIKKMMEKLLPKTSNLPNHLKFVSDTLGFSVKSITTAKTTIYTNICTNNWCNGKIENDVCDLCEFERCSKCREMTKSLRTHQCEKETLASLEEINKFFNCPACKIPIEKSYGCMYITCAVCGCKFEHLSGTLTTHGGHSTMVKVKEITSIFDKMSIKNFTNQEVKEILNAEKIIKKPNKLTQNSFQAFEKYLVFKDLQDEARKYLSKMNK
jgi:hypothetical protein